MTESEFGGKLGVSTHTGELDLDDEVRELWYIIEDIKNYAFDYATKYSPAEPVAIDSKDLLRLNPNDLEFIRQRLNGWKVNEGRHAILWDDKECAYYLVPTA